MPTPSPAPHVAPHPAWQGTASLAPRERGPRGPACREGRLPRHLEHPRSARAVGPGEGGWATGRPVSRLTGLQIGDPI